MIIAPLWFFAQWTYSAGVATTSVTASTVISTTSVVWTLLGSILFLREKVTVPRRKSPTEIPKDEQMKLELWLDLSLSSYSCNIVIDIVIDMVLVIDMIVL